MNCKFGKKWTEVFVAYVEILFQKLPGGAEERHETT
jgi:hypothetical protein